MDLGSALGRPDPHTLAVAPPVVEYLAYVRGIGGEKNRTCIPSLALRTE